MSRYRKFTAVESLKVLAVELIRRLWDSGRYRKNKILRRIHDNWFELWVAFKTQVTMRDVDRQTAELVHKWEAERPSAVDNYVYSQVMKGETPLGGEMRITHRSVQDK
mgnify:CR=1 FL=1